MANMDAILKPESSRRIVNIQQACELAGVTRRTLYNWMDAGKVDYIRTAGGSRRIFADTLFRERESRPATSPAP